MARLLSLSKGSPIEGQQDQQAREDRRGLKALAAQQEAQGLKVRAAQAEGDQQGKGDLRVREGHAGFPAFLAGRGLKASLALQE